MEQYRFITPDGVFTTANINTAEQFKAECENKYNLVATHKDLLDFVWIYE